MMEGTDSKGMKRKNGVRMREKVGDKNHHCAREKHISERYCKYVDGIRKRISWEPQNTKEGALRSRLEITVGQEKACKQGQT
jgi:hypothetical protein